MVILRMVVCRVQELFELRVCDWGAVDVEAEHVYGLDVDATRGVFPGVLNVDAWVIAALDFDAADAEVEVGGGDEGHAGWGGGGGFGRRHGDHGLGDGFEVAGVAGEQALGAVGHEG